MKRIVRNSAIMGLCLVIICGSSLAAWTAEPNIADYTAYPIFMAGQVPPLVMLVMGRSHKLYYEAYNDASDLDGDGTLDVRYNPDIDYYGYFDSHKYYEYNSSEARFEPVGTTSDKTAPDGNYWSGDFLNYLTMSRMDCLRKVLYGGYRSTDSTTETVLQRSYIPQDAHSWGKEYTSPSVDGYDIRDYTPFDLPQSGRRHLFASTTLSENGSPLLRVLLNNTHRIWEWVSKERPVADSSCGTPTDYVVRVLVCESGLEEDNCKTYPDGTKKPVGLLQIYGETERMYFGLISGSYDKNTSGGVLRKTIGSITDEIDPDTGQFTSTHGIIHTINSFRISRFGYNDYAYHLPGESSGWPDSWVTTRPMEEGEFPDWGNPIAEMMYEALRYFGGKSTPTSAYVDASMPLDESLGLPKVDWDDPYSTYPYCSKPYMLVISDINPTYDSDQLPGVDSNFGSGVSGDLPNLNAKNIADEISDEEGISGNSYFIGQSGNNYDGAPTPKTVQGFGSIRGLCPDEPTKQGSYYSAAMAYYGHANDLNAATGDQKTETIAVALASPLPRIEIPVGDQKITLVPFAKSVGGCLGINGAEGRFQPTNQIVDFYVEEITPTSGTFRINFEDVEQGADHDMDAIVEYEYVLNGDGSVTISLNSTYASGCIIQHLGYVISGTTHDGIYLEVRDADTGSGSDVDYFLDTPPGQYPSGNWNDGQPLPLSTTRTFYPGTTTGATLLKNPLWYAAKWGGFEDRDGDNQPNLDVEWDEDGNGQPDNYFYVTNPLRLEEQLTKSFTAILRKAASGTAVSVLATTGEGEGNVVQAYFKPSLISGVNEVKWVGYLQSLWVDPRGNLREDTDQDHGLDIYTDKIIKFYQDPGTGDTRIKRYSVDADNPYPNLETASYETIGLEDLQPIWEAGKLLGQREADTRKIFTYLDKDKDQTVDEATNDPFDHSGEVVSFDTSSASAIKPYLGVADDTAWSYLGATHDERVQNLIQFIRGEAISGLRNRTIDGNVWKLGDIVHSTPVSISKPVENYHLIYSDESYGNFCNTFKNRETVVYVGANDGMLHAFTSWRFDNNDKQYVNEDVDGDPLGTEEIGDELWAYIPQALLPHLKWLADPDYTHVYYVDLKPKVFDAKILPDDTHYTDTDADDNWGTFLLVGLRMGGKHIWAEGDYDDGTGSTVHETRHFYPSYSLIDVTDPRNPRLIWERTYTDLGMSMSIPAIVKVKNNWFAVFGSGPEDYDGTSSNKGHIFVVDLKTGEPYKNGTNDWLFETSENNAFMNSPVSLDKDLNYNVDVIYFGEAYLQGSNWKGKLYKIMVPWVNGGAYDGSDPNNYIDDPKDSANPWILRSLFNATRPITSPVALSIDNFDNIWVYVGSGRYLSESDKSNTDQQYLFGVKDPFYNEDQASYYHNYTANLELSISDLFDADPYIVTEGGAVYKSDGSYYGTFEDTLLPEARGYDGWVRSLGLDYYRNVDANKAGERVVTKFAVLGGIVFTPSFVPNEDICGFGGESYLYGQYYETGTAYYEEVFDEGTTTIDLNGTKTVVLDVISLGSGKASAVGVHIGMEEGAKAFIQQSTGTIVGTKLKPAFNVKSGLKSWREQ